MLLNEFLKEHKAVQELKSALRKQEAIIAQLSDDRANHQTTISNLGKVLNAVLLRLNEQDSKIQKVNDRLEQLDSETLATSAAAGELSRSCNERSHRQAQS